MSYDSNILTGNGDLDQNEMLSPGGSSVLTRNGKFRTFPTYGLEGMGECYKQVQADPACAHRLDPPFLNIGSRPIKSVFTLIFTRELIETISDL